MEHTATYSPEDNKLRLYPAYRLEREVYDRVKSAGFIWAPKQELFVAPMWTPSREDLLIELCGEIGDEDKSLVERQEERAERFSDYSDNRAADAAAAHSAVKALADNIPLGQPILVGHHSEKHARRDAEKIENGMRRAVRMWETAKYWKDRAAGAIAHAKYKELPSVRARRIKGLEADQRKQQKTRDTSERMLKMWETIHDDEHTVIKMKDGTKGDFLRRARALANYDTGYIAHDGGNWWSAWDILRPEGERYSTCPVMTPEEVQQKVIERHKRTMAHCDRWLTHLANRLEYERAMLGEAGGTASDRTKPEKGGGVRCWAGPRGGWAYIVKVNKVSVTVLDNWGNGGGNFTRTIPFDKLTAVMSASDVEEKREAGLLKDTDDGTGFYLLDAVPASPKTDAEDFQTIPQPAPEPQPQEADFSAMRDTLKNGGVKVVVANQLFPTPPELAERMVQLASLRPKHDVLEPSAGTGAIINAIANAEPSAAITAVEINNSLCRRLNTMPPVYRTVEADFLTCNGDLGKFDRVLMNPPFENGADIKHIKHALTFLKPGGVLVAICANGPRQNAQLQPLSTEWEELPEGTFAGTGVRAVLLTIEQPGDIRGLTQEVRTLHEANRALDESKY